jgi:hypothetical protein
MNRVILVFWFGLASCAGQQAGARPVVPQAFAARITADSAVFSYPMVREMLRPAPAPAADPRFGIAWIASWRTPSIKGSRCAEKCALSFLTTEPLGPEAGLLQLRRLLSRGERRFDVWLSATGQVALEKEPALRVQEQPWGVRLVLPPSPTLTELLVARPDSVEMQLLVGPADTSYGAWATVEYPS